MIFPKLKKTFFGNLLPEKDKKIFLVAPIDFSMFQKMFSASVKGIIDVLERRYSKSFATVENSVETVLTSVRQHTMEIESVIGEY